MAMSAEVKSKAMLIGTALAGQSLESPCDEGSQGKALLSSGRDRRPGADRGQVVGRREGIASGRTQPPAEAPADVTKSAGIEERNAALRGESTDEAYRAALEAWLPWRPPGRRRLAYQMVEHAFFGLTRSRSSSQETHASDGGTEVKKGREVQ